MWGTAQLGRWKWHDPDVNADLLVDNDTRVWVYSPGTTTCSDPAAMIGYCDQAQGSSRTFVAQYKAVHGANGHFDIPTGGQHDWSSWGPTTRRHVRRPRRHPRMNHADEWALADGAAPTNHPLRQ